MLLPRRPPDGYIDPSLPPPDPNNDAQAPVIIYGYTPHLALNILALILYGIFFFVYIYHLFASFFRRVTSSSTPARPTSRPFTILILIAIIFEVVGYAFRLQSSPPPVGDPYNVINFVVQYFFIVVAPALISAGIYTTITSLIRFLGERLGDRGDGEKETERFTPLRRFGVKRRSIVVVFVICDVIATIVQVAGAALIGVSESNGKSPDTGNNILLAGLAFQVFSFLLFIILYIIFIVQNLPPLSKPDLQPARARVPGGLRTFVGVTLLATLLVYLRTIFRLAETSQGVGGYASSHEVFFGVLEFAPVVVAVGLMGVWHPGRFVGRRKEVGGLETSGLGGPEREMSDGNGVQDAEVGKKKRFGVF